MKILDKVQKVFNQHELKPINIDETGTFPNVYIYLGCYPEMAYEFKSEKTDGYFINKYSKHIPKGWYGFDIGTPIIPVWLDILDKVLEICVEADPDFEIHQIKLKFGGIRFYVGSQNIEDLHEVERLIDNNLFDKALIY